MSYPKKSRHRVPDYDLKPQVTLQIIDYLDRHPMRFVEARAIMSAPTLARRVAEWVFSVQTEEV